MHQVWKNGVLSIALSILLLPTPLSAVPVYAPDDNAIPRILPDRPAPPPPSALPHSEQENDQETRPPAPHGAAEEENAPDTPADTHSDTENNEAEKPNTASHPPADAPEILSDVNALPEPVRAMRQKLIDAAITGNADNLRPIIKSLSKAPAFTFTEQGLDETEKQDPIEALRKASFDGEGREILAILAEVMEARFVLVDKGTPQEMYVWPYFAQYPVDKLTPEQIVELFRIVTAFEFKEMNDFGAYNFYRIGITPDGTWQYMVTGD